MAQQVDHMASSTGQVMTAASWLDTHFEAAKTDYEAQLRMVGIQPGWHVLDAACGSGSFFPWLAELVGPIGHLSALDLAPDNVAVVERRLTDWKLPCSVSVRVGSIVDLPYPDNTFDAVWFANTSQYLTDVELEATLAEFKRAVRPGGLVAVKETDVTMYRVEPSPPGLILRWMQARASIGDVHAVGALRAPDLPNWMRESGLVDVWRKSTLIEYAAPLGNAPRKNWRDQFTYLAALATEMELPTADRIFWSGLRDPEALECYLDDPSCWLAECNVLVVGAV